MRINGPVDHDHPEGLGQPHRDARRRGSEHIGEHQHPAAAATQAQTTAPAATSTQETPAPATVKHTVKQGETLWSIASDHLGDGRRYKEIVELNRSILGDQPGFIKAGWVLDVPTPPAPASAAFSLGVPLMPVLLLSS